MLTSRKELNLIVLLFLFSLIPPSLGLLAYYRYEDFYIMAFMKTNLPDFSWSSFIKVFYTKIYEYHRPVTNFIYWIGYLVSYNEPVLLHSLASLFYGFVAVILYLISRFFLGVLSSTISVLIFVTFGPVVTISWWTGTFAILPGLLLFLSSILFFLHIPKSPRLYTWLSFSFLILSFFMKESFIILSPLFFLFCISSPDFRTRNHFIIALGLIPFALAKVYIANVIIGATVNEHVHFNILEVDPNVIWSNLYSFWKLLTYGHNYWFVLLAFLSISPKVFQDERKVWLFIPLVCVVVLSFRVLHQTWPIDLVMFVLSILYLWYCTFYERIWMAWISLGLSQLVFWDIPIIGGIMNRMILEPSIGFALLIGAGLSRQIEFIQSSGFSLKRPLQLLYGSRISMLKFVTCVSVIFGGMIGIGEEIFILGGRQLGRDMVMWYNQGAVLEDIIDHIVEEVPPEAALIISEPPLDGMQVTDQLGDALFLFDRSDISISYATGDMISQTVKNMETDQPIFLVSSNPYDEGLLRDQQPIIQLEYESEHGVFDGYIYKLNARLQEP